MVAGGHNHMFEHDGTLAGFGIVRVRQIGHRIATRPVVWVAVTLLLMVPVAARADCTLLAETFTTAKTAGDIDTMRDSFERISVEPGCSDDFRGWASTVVARALETRARMAWKQGAAQTEIRALLEASLNYQKNWRVLAQLGDMSADYGDYGRAATFYQQSLDLIAIEESTPTAPPPAMIQKIFRRAQEARLLAPETVETPITRSGAPGGLGLRQLRGFTVEKVAVPIRFEFDEDIFTEAGRRAAEDMLAMLRRENEPAVVLIGHTDPAGEAGYNMKLSLRRAAAVRDFLRGNGYRGQIRVDARGESEPLTVDDPTRYSTEQLHQMYRRVELVR